MVARLRQAGVAKIGLELAEGDVYVGHYGGLCGLGLVADLEEVAGEVLGVVGDVGEGVVKVLAAEDEQAEKGREDYEEEPDEGLELAEAVLVVVEAEGLVEFDGGGVAHADEAAGVEDEDEEDEDECEDGHGGPEEDGLEVVGVVGVEGGVGDEEPHVEVGQGVEGVHDQVHVVAD